MEYCGALRRFAAFVTDNVLIQIGIFILTAPLLTVLGGAGDDTGFYVTAAAETASILYFTLFIASKYRTTPGGLIMRIETADKNGMPVSLERAYIRTVAVTLMHLAAVWPLVKNGVPADESDIAPAAAATALLIPVLWCIGCFTREDKAALHDIIAGTRVIKRTENN